MGKDTSDSGRDRAPDVDAPSPTRQRRITDDRGKRVRPQLLAWPDWCPERDYDFAERAAIGRAEYRMLLQRARVTRMGVWLLVILALSPMAAMAIAGWIDMDDPDTAAIVRYAGAAVSAVVVLSLVAFLWRMSVPADAVAARLSAGLCGRCSRRLDRTAVANGGMATCRRCRLAWSDEHVGPVDPQAVADRRPCSGKFVFGKDCRGTRVPFAAAFDGPWPSPSRYEDATKPDERMESAGDMRFRSFSKVAASWISRWRCPCCDANLSAYGRWHVWGFPTVICDRCQCIWIIPPLKGLVARGVNMCFWCGYDMSGVTTRHDEAGHCPECGKVYLGAMIARCRSCNTSLDATQSVRIDRVRCSRCNTDNDLRWSIPGSINPMRLAATANAETPLERVE